MRKSDTVQMLAIVDREKSVALKKRLIDEGISYRSWLENQIDAYLKQSKQRRKSK